MRAEREVLRFQPRRFEFGADCGPGPDSLSKGEAAACSERRRKRHDPEEEATVCLGFARLAGVGLEARERRVVGSEGAPIEGPGPLE